MTTDRWRQKWPHSIRVSIRTSCPRRRGRWSWGRSWSGVPRVEFGACVMVLPPADAQACSAANRAKRMVLNGATQSTASSILQRSAYNHYSPQPQNLLIASSKFHQDETNHKVMPPSRASHSIQNQLTHSLYLQCKMHASDPKPFCNHHW